MTEVFLAVIAAGTGVIILAMLLGAGLRPKSIAIAGLVRIEMEAPGEVPSENPP